MTQSETEPTPAGWQPDGSAATPAATPELPDGATAAETASDLAGERQDGSAAERLREEARQVYRQSVAAEMPLSGRKLGEMFERSERWGRDRIKEVKTADSAQVNETLPPPAAGLPDPLPENGNAGAADTAATDLAVPESSIDAATPAATPELPDGATAAETASDLAGERQDGSAAPGFGAAAVVPDPPAATPAAAPLVPNGSAASGAASSGVPEISERQAVTPRVAARWPRRWPLMLLAVPAGVATWSGWVGLGGFTGFGVVHPLPGIWDSATINSAITLPIGVEAYAAYALSAWLTSAPVSHGTRKFAKVSAVAALVLGMLGQVAYHLLDVAHNAKVSDFAQKHAQSVKEAAKHVPTAAPWWITTLVACLPVLVLGFGAGLAHMLRRDQTE